MILVTHGNLAEEFVHAMQHVVGRQEAVATVCIGPNDDMERRRREIAAAINRSTAATVRSSSPTCSRHPSNLAHLADEGRPRKK
jgi:PTS system mannose-specific IIA component